MADIQYLNYGDQQVEQQALMDNLSNQVTSYVNSQPWSKKRKDKFMSAYSDIMNRGLIGASNSTGQWQLDVGGDTIDFDSMDKKDREMYGEAAYFIRSQMSSLAANKKAEEEKKKADLQKFDNKYFVSSLTNQISNNLFGGRQFTASEDWNPLDTRGENGLRAKTNRANKLAEELQKYSDSLDESKLDFENSPFKDINDLKTRIGNAINVLRSGEDPTEALNAIGLKASDWFNDGSGDNSGKVDDQGNPLTYQQVTELQQAEQEAKLKAEAQKQAALEKANKGVMNWSNGIHAVEARNAAPDYQEYIAKQYGTGQQGFNNINIAVQGLLEKAYSGQISNAEKKQLGNLLYYIRSNNPNSKSGAWNIKPDEWKELLTHNKHLASQNQQDYVRLPWQMSDGRYTYADNKGNLYFLKPANQKKFANPTVNRNQAYQNYKNNFLSNTKAGIDKQQQDFLKQQGFNTADIAELTGIGLDIASIIDPEPFSAAGLGTGAAMARTIARKQDPKSWGLSDYFWTVVDYGTGLLGALPIVGDMALTSKTAANVAKWYKRVARIPAVIEMVQSTPGAATALGKITSGESLTVQDWRSLGEFVRGFTANRQINVSNRAQRRALEKSGYDLSDQNGYLKKLGIRSTKTPTTQSTVKVNVKGKEVEIPIKSKEKLDAELKKAGNNQSKKDAVVRENTEVKEYITNQKLKPEDVTAVSSSSLRNSRIFGERFGVLPESFRTTSANFGTTTNTKPTNPNTLETYLSGDRGLWDRFKYGSNRIIRRFAPKETIEQNVSTNSGQNNQTETKPDREIQFDRATINRYKKVLSGNFSNKPVQEGTLEIDGITFKVAKNKNGKFTITDNVPVSPEHPRRLHSNLSETTVKKKMAEIVQERRKQTNSSGKVTKKSTKEIGKLLQDMKKKGWLKQGGKITDNQIDIFLNNYK